MQYGIMAFVTVMGIWLYGQSGMALPAYAMESGKAVELVDGIEPCRGVPHDGDFQESLLVHFKDETHGIHFATSRGGYTFTGVNGGAPVLPCKDLAEQKHGAVVPITGEELDGLEHFFESESAPGESFAEQAEQATYCNPLSIPNYPVGRLCRRTEPGTPAGEANLWLLDQMEQYRELADVSVLWFDQKWHMYPSCDMAWVSADGVKWEHCPLNVRDIGYAPTIVRHQGRFLLMASGSAIHVSASPLGPFEPIGKIDLPSGLPSQTDPMLFSDDDGRLYYYWGCTPSDGIYGVELDADQPTHILGKPAKLLGFESERNPWQRVGDWNEDVNRSWIEGAWMLKRNGVYYLTYCAGGTENRTYCVACLTSQSPLGPFTPQKHNPILRTTEGLVTGTGHGSFVAGPNGSLWAFYTLRACAVHGFERRLGMDPVCIGEDGELRVMPASSTPQRLTGDAKGAEPAGWLPLNANRRSGATSTAENLNTRLAVDNDLRTWWQPAANDPAPSLTSHLADGAEVRAVRIVWRDIGLDTRAGIEPGAFSYQVELETAPGQWVTAVDRSASNEDLLIDYRECAPIRARAARLTVFGAPRGVTPGVAEFTVFGKTEKK